MPGRAAATGEGGAGHLTDLANLDLYRDGVRCPRRRRWVSRLLALVWGGLLCEGCLRASTRVSPAGGRRMGSR